MRAALVSGALLGAVLVSLALFGAQAVANTSIDVEQRAVRGSCAESYLDIFAAAREVTFSGDYTRVVIGVDVVRDPKTGTVVEARPTVRGQSPLSEADTVSVLEGVRRAYLRPEPEGCVGVVAGRAEWVLRFGEKTALAAPDDPLVINRATASTRLRNRSGAVELLDPTTARTRITLMPGDVQAGARCFPTEMWRDFGPLPPVDLMPRGSRYRVQFYIEPNGRTDRVAITDLVGASEPSTELRAALDDYVRTARFYPPITDECRTRNAHGIVYVGRD